MNPSGKKEESREAICDTSDVEFLGVVRCGVRISQIIAGKGEGGTSMGLEVPVAMGERAKTININHDDIDNNIRDRSEANLQIL